MRIFFSHSAGTRTIHNRPFACLLPVFSRALPVFFFSFFPVTLTVESFLVLWFGLVYRIGAAAIYVEARNLYVITAFFLSTKH